MQLENFLYINALIVFSSPRFLANHRNSFITDDDEDVLLSELSALKLICNFNKFQMENPTFENGLPTAFLCEQSTDTETTFNVFICKV